MHRVVLGERLVGAEPARDAELAVQDQKGIAAAAAPEVDAHAGGIDEGFRERGHVVSLPRRR